MRRGGRTMNKTKIELDNFDKKYVLKEIFLYNLTMNEFRLCVFLTSKINKTLKNMSYEEKLWCVGGKKAKVKELILMNHKLIELGLIQKNGMGHHLKDRRFCLPRPDMFYACKSVRQVFIVCLEVWHKKGDYVSIDKEYVHTQLGEVKFRRNENIKRIKETMGINFTLEERANDFLYISLDSKPIEVEKKSTKAKNKNISGTPIININKRDDTPLPPIGFNDEDLKNIV